MTATDVTILVVSTLAGLAGLIFGIVAGRRSGTPAAPPSVSLAPVLEAIRASKADLRSALSTLTSASQHHTELLQTLIAESERSSSAHLEAAQIGPDPKVLRESLTQFTAEQAASITALRTDLDHAIATLGSRLAGRGDREFAQENARLERRSGLLRAIAAVPVDATGKHLHPLAALPDLVNAISVELDLGLVVLADDAGLPLASSSKGHAARDDEEFAAAEVLAGEGACALRVLERGNPARTCMISHADQTCTLHRFFRVGLDNFTLSARSRERSVVPTLLDPALAAFEHALLNRTRVGEGSTR